MTNKGQVGEETVYFFETLKGMVAWGGGGNRRGPHSKRKDEGSVNYIK